jgi:parvulin-like peptidyl-prolyl isomerase
MNDLAGRAEDIGLAKAAEELGLEVKQTGLFKEGDAFVPGLGRASDAAFFAFSEKKGSLGGPFENETGIYLVSVRERQDAGLPALDKIKEQVRSAVRREKQKGMAREKAVDFQRRVEQAGDFQTAASAAALPLVETEAFSRRDYVPQIGRANEFIGTAFGLPEGTISGLVETNRGYYILQVIGREQADPERFAEQKEALRLDILRSKQNQAFTDWFEGIKGRAQIEDYRDRFFKS